MGLNIQARMGLLVLATSLMLLECTPEDHNESSTAADVRTALSELSKGAAVYGFAYTAAPPTGERLRFAVETTSTDSLCNQFKGGAPEGIFWYLRAELNSTADGQYAVGRNADLTGTATFVLTQVENGKKKATYRAIDGDITISRSGNGMMGAVTTNISARFPLQQSHAAECQAEGTAEGVTTNKCVCVSDEGNRTECLANGSEDCCPPPSGELVNFTATLVSSYCPSLCSFTSPELAQYCHANVH
jgi:hypothetical protein